MKYLVLVPDGMADEKVKELGDLTPMEKADKPYMDMLAKKACVGTVSNVPEGMVPESDTANMAIMSFDPKMYSKGRSPLEALSMGLSMDSDDTAIRCNIITLSEYTEFLWNCLSQNLMQGQVEVLNRQLYSDLMQKKISLIAGSVSDFQRIVENEVRRKNYKMASAMLKEMHVLYPDSEAYYLSRISYLAAIGRGDDIQLLLQEIGSKEIFLSSATKEVLAFWET